MSSWRDATSYSKREKIRVPRMWELKDSPNKYRVFVHQHTAYGDMWFLTCHDLDITMVDLETTDPDVAKDTAIKRLISYTDCRITKLQYFRDFLQNIDAGSDKGESDNQ